MARIVMKFGGTSMAGIERIRHVAAGDARGGGRQQVAVVVSAMAGETDRSGSSSVREPPRFYDPREYDGWWRPASRSPAAVLAITLQGMG
jgi:aspartate kinase